MQCALVCFNAAKKTVWTTDSVLLSVDKWSRHIKLLTRSLSRFLWLFGLKFRPYMAYWWRELGKSVFRIIMEHTISTIHKVGLRLIITGRIIQINGHSLWDFLTQDCTSGTEGQVIQKSVKVNKTIHVCMICLANHETAIPWYFSHHF